MRMSTPLVLYLVSVSGCWYTAAPDDAGDEAFVAQAVETILGRKPRGGAEIVALSSLASTSGREAVVRVLFEEPDFVDYWSNVLIDDVQLQRAGAMQVDADCTAPALLAPKHSVALANHLATAPPEQPFCYSTGPVFQAEVSGDSFISAWQAAEESYPYDLLDDLKAADPMSDPAQYPAAKDPGVPKGKSKLPDLLAGAGETNGNGYTSDGKSGVQTTANLGRWVELVDGLSKTECPPFNLTDVAESAVRADRIDALYRAYLPVLATFPGTSVDAAMRKELGGAFLDIYVDRDPSCMTCHTSTYSKTDARPLNQNWDRFVPIRQGMNVPLDAEGTAFSFDSGNSFVYNADGGAESRQHVEPFFRAQNHASSGLKPWGMDEVCVTNPNRGFGGLIWGGLANDPYGQTAAFAGVGPSINVGVLDLVVAISDGTSSLNQMSLSPPDWGAYRSGFGANPNPATPSCTGCHSGQGAAPALETKVPTMTDRRLFSIIRNGWGEMPAVASSDQQAWDNVEWIRQNYAFTPAVQMDDRSHGLVLLMAANIVNQVVDEVAGEDLVMPHGFPRNVDQATALSSLTNTLMTSGFSLRALLSEIVLSDAFNRRSPQEQTTLPYDLPLLTVPEAEVSPTIQPALGDNANSQGDLVHRHGPAGLFQQVHAALGWPSPPLHGDDQAYPNADLMTSAGRYTSRRLREHEQVSLSSFLAWETEVATCRKPDLVFAGDVSLVAGSTASATDLVGPGEWVDWIDVLAADAESRNDTWNDLARAIKDRLLAEDSFTSTEWQAIATMWGVQGTNSPVWTVFGGGDGVVSAAEEDLLRDYCGALLASPQFMLRGVVESPPPPGQITAYVPALADPSCLPGEVCGAPALTAYYAAQYASLPADPNEPANAAGGEAFDLTEGGSCFGACGGAGDGCYCDSSCSTYGDCCLDFEEACP